MARAKIVLHRDVAACGFTFFVSLSLVAATILIGYANFPAPPLQNLPPLSGPAGVFNPANISGLKLWLKADSLALNDGDAVASWSDSSGNGANATQTTAGLKPTFKTSILNSKPVVRFNTQALIVPLSLAGSTYTAFVVGTKSAAGNSNQQYSRLLSAWKTTDNPANPGDYASTHAIIFSGITVANLGAPPPDVFAYRNGATLGGITVSYATFYVFSFTINGTATELRSNGASPVTATTSATALSADQVLVGCSPVGASGDGRADSELNGDIAEAIIYNSALSAADRQSVERYLGAKYGISVP